MKPEIDSETVGLGTSGESVKESRQLATRLREQIINLARDAGEDGLSINDAERLIGDHKGHSISPRFSELVARGLLVRVVIGRGRPTRRFPQGAPRYRTRYDRETRRRVILHWLPEFVPAANADEQELSEVGRP